MDLKKKKYLHQNFERCPPQETGFTGSEAASSLTNVALPGTVLKVLLFSQLTKWMLAWGWDPIWTTIVVKAGSFLHSFMWGSVKRVRHSILIITTTSTSHVCSVTMRKKNSGDAVFNISCCENTSINRADYKRNVAIWRFQFCNNCNSIAIVVIETILMFLMFLWFGFCLFSFLIWVKWPFIPNTLAQQFLALSQTDVADTNEQRLQPFPKYRLKNPQSHTDWCLMGVNHVIATCIGTRDCHN